MNNQEEIIKSIKNRGLNDYSADKVSHNQKPLTIPTRKSALCISSSFPGMRKDDKWQQN